MYGNPPPYPSGKSQMSQVSLSWVPASNGIIPTHAVSVGGNVCVARASHNGEMIPCKVARGHQSAFVPYGGIEHCVRNYEVLCDTSLQIVGQSFSWAACNPAYGVPNNAIVGGFTASNEPLYIGKAIVNGEPVAGKVYLPHQCAYFPWGGKEIPMQQFDILVQK